MNETWQGFLSEQGARIEQQQVVDFGQPEQELAAALEQDTLCDLSHRALIRASGADCSEFLQGQLSNDIRQVGPSRHQLSSYCTPKGRILALFRIFQRQDDYCLTLPRELLAPTLKRLRMFVLRSQVTLEPDEALIGIGLAGPNSEKLLSAQLGALPALPDESVEQQGVSVLRLAGKHPRFALYGELNTIQGLWQALAADCRPIGRQGQDLQTIHSALPEVLPETSEAFVPQMLNLQLVNGVNFKKGCYTGQEVVARMHYLGKLKRRMYLAHLPSDSPIHPGEELASPQSSSGQGAGKVVLAAPNPQGGQDLLAVAEVSVAESGGLYLAEQENVSLSLLPMPYEFE